MALTISRPKIMWNRRHCKNDLAQNERLTQVLLKSPSGGVFCEITPLEVEKILAEQLK
jgi:hypothetical protein